MPKDTIGHCHCMIDFLFFPFRAGSPLYVMLGRPLALDNFNDVFFGVPLASWLWGSTISSIRLRSSRSRVVSLINASSFCSFSLDMSLERMLCHLHIIHNVQHGKGASNICLPSMTITHRFPRTPPLAFFYAAKSVDLHALVHVLASRLVAF